MKTSIRNSWNSYKKFKIFYNKDGYLIHADNYTQDNLRNFKRDHLKRPKSVCLQC